MSIKYFCDACGIEIGRDYVSKRYMPAKYFRDKYVNVACEVIVKIDGTWNGGHICYPCLLAVMSSPDCELKR